MLSNEHANHKNVCLKSLNKILMPYLPDCVCLHSASSPVNLTGRINGVVGLTGFSDRRMCELLLGPYKSGRNKGVVVWPGSTVYEQWTFEGTREKPKGRFTRYDYVAYDKLTTGLRHELFRVNQTYNSLNGPKSCRRPVVSLSYATKSYRVNRP